MALQKRLARLDGAPSRPAATNGRRDDLQAIVGIGPVLERKLNELGIVSWEQVAALDEAGVARVSAHLPGVPGRIERDRWVAQAADLVERFLDGRPDDAPLAVARSPLEGSRSAKGPR
jgi:NADH-quinone oxidoreductase subunit E